MLGTMAPSGALGLQIVRRSPETERLQRYLRTFNPRTHLGRKIRDILAYLPASAAADLLDELSSVVVVESSLRIVVERGLGLLKTGLILPRDVVREDHGVVGRKVVTTAGVNFIVDAFQNITELENFKYHALGTGSTAEAAGDTALVTELTTQYTGNVRATGTTVEGASANIFESVATNTLDETPGAALREHGVMSQAATGGGSLLDRTVFAAINLTSGDGLTSTYDLTLAAGG